MHLEGHQKKSISSELHGLKETWVHELEACDIPIYRVGYYEALGPGNFSLSVNLGFTGSAETEGAGADFFGLEINLITPIGASLSCLAFSCLILAFSGTKGLIGVVRALSLR